MLIGRENELETLRSVLDSDKSEFVAVYGRRRVGKTFLIREAYDYRFAFEHSGVKGASMKVQLREFGEKLRKCGRKGKKAPADWFEAFRWLGELLESRNEPGKMVVFLDECPWMDTPKSGFAGALDHFWNGWATMRKDVVLIVCGSAASWVASKIDEDTGGLHNRLTRHVYLRPFTLHECDLLAKSRGIVMNRAQTLECYMVFGGIPYYWELLRRDQGLAQNVDRILFAPRGDLHDEFDHLYTALFRRPEPYLRIIRALGGRRSGLTRDELIAASGLTGNGKLTRMLRELEQCDFIRSYSVPGKGKGRHGALYQLMDNFTLFYFRFLDGVREPAPDFWTASEGSQAVRTWCGLAFERVALQHVAQIKRKLGISGVATRTYEWRYAPEDGDSGAGAQIDLVIDRADRVTNLCEMKCTAAPFEITDDYDRRLRQKRETYREKTGTRNAIHLTMVSAGGVRRNANWNDIQSEVTLDDLFAF
ncbi:MAG: ATP-binding protein [Kiritimatiellae bacterium]|nr:ATP-binding protein [Kiritimatiellia bacterium]